MRKLICGLSLFCVFSIQASEECFVDSPLDKDFLSQTDTIQEKLGEGKRWISCLESLQAHNSVPDTAVTQFWHNLGGKKVFGLRCKFLDNDAKSQKIFTVLGDEGFKTITFPAIETRVKSSLGGYETSRHPRTYIKFNQGGKTYFISEFNKVGDDFDLLTDPKLANTNYVKNYDKALKEKKLTNSFSPVVPNDMSGAKGCVEYQMKRFLDLVVSSTPIQNLPTNDEMRKDSTQINLPSNTKGKYSKSAHAIKSEYVKKIKLALPSCDGVIREEMLNEVIDNNYKSRFDNFQSTRSKINP